MYVKGALSVLSPCPFVPPPPPVPAMLAHANLSREYAIPVPIPKMNIARGCWAGTCCLSGVEGSFWKNW